MGPLKLYYDFMSQPCRALYILLEHHRIPFEPVFINLKKEQNKTEAYQKISKLQKVPAIDDEGFKLTESIAILRYLSRTQNLPDAFYPQDVKKQSRIDEYLEWQHNNVRYFLGMHFYYKWLMPIVQKQPINPETQRFIEKDMIGCINGFEKQWLEPGPYICGTEITAADLWAACEMEQPRLSAYDPRQNRHVLKTWLEMVRQHFNPTYDKTHRPIYILEQRAKEQMQQK